MCTFQCLVPPYRGVEGGVQGGYKGVRAQGGVTEVHTYVHTHTRTHKHVHARARTHEPRESRGKEKEGTWALGARTWRAAWRSAAIDNILRSLLHGSPQHILHMALAGRPRTAPKSQPILSLPP